MEKYGEIGNQCISELRTLRLFVALCRDGLSFGSEHRRIHNLLERGATTLRRPDLAPLPLQEDAADREAFAISQLEQGFPYLYNIAAIRAWSILENFIDEIVMERIKHMPPGMTSGLGRIKGPLIEFMYADDDERIELILEKLKESTEAPLKKGCGRFEALLGAVGFGGAVHEVPRRILLEMSEVRNAIVHRNGIADRRFCTACPWFSIERGRPLSLAVRHLSKYTVASAWYVSQVYQRIDPDGEKSVENVKSMEYAISELIRYESNNSNDSKDDERST